MLNHPTDSISNSYDHVNHILYAKKDLYATFSIISLKKTVYVEALDFLLEYIKTRGRGYIGINVNVDIIIQDIL